MEERKPLLYLVDGSNALHRAYHAIRSLSNSKGFPTNAIFGFNAILKKLVREHKPTHVGIAFDVSESTFRKEAFADYKAHRKPMEEELRVQIPFIKRLCEAFRMPVLELDQFEADDVIATLAQKAVAEGFDVVIFTTDKDFLQLVSPHIRVYQAMREKMLDEKGVEEFFGVPPGQVGDVLALMGDASDNVPGVPGIGEVGARKLVKEYGNLENLLAHAGDVTAKKTREALQQNVEQARLSRRLIELERNLPLELDPKALALDPPDNTKLKELYSELEFHTFARELEAPAEGEAVSFRRIAAAEPWEPKGPRVGVALESEDEKFFVALSDGESTVCASGSESEAAARLRALSAKERLWVSPDAKRTYALMLAEGWKKQPRFFDIGLARYVLACGTATPEFSAMSIDLLGRKARGDSGEESLAEEAAWGLEMQEILARDLDARPNLKKIFDEIETPLTPILAKMEAAGILLDRPFLEKLSARLGKDLARLEAEIFSEAGEPFNVSSPQQLSRILFEKLKLPAGKKTAKTKSLSTGAETLQALSAQGYRIATLLTEHREISKLKGTYADALPQLADAGGRVHARFNQTVAATGRLSSSDPNLQNIPIRTEAGREMRRAFIAPKGSQLLAADYSQIELRVLAHLSGDEAMIRAFQDGHDVHAATASKVFGVSPDLVSIEMRSAAKRINFGLLYGMGAFSLAKDLGVSNAEAKEFIEAYFGQFPKVRETLAAVLEGARREGVVRTIFGRERPIPEIHSSNGAVRANAERMAQNAPFQGSAADIVKIAMIRVDRRLSEQGMKTRMLLQVHDELIFEAPDEELAEARRIAVSEMEGAAELAVPLKVDAASGPTWLEAKG